MNSPGDPIFEELTSSEDHAFRDSSKAEPTLCGCTVQAPPGLSGGATGTTSALDERILAASPIEWDQHEATLTFHASEPGTVDLGRLLISVTAFGTAEEARTEILDEHARVTSILVFNGYQKVRGLGYLEAPAGVFSPRRRQSSIDLGTLRLESGDNLAVTVAVGEAWSKTLSLLLAGAVAFRPDAQRREAGAVSQPAEPHVFLVSPSRRIAPGSYGQLTLDFEEDGLVDLATLQLIGLPQVAPCYPQDVLSRTLVESIRLPSGQDVVLGNQNTEDESADGSAPFPVAAPASMLSHLETSGPWAQTGRVWVRRGQQITLRLRHVGANSTGPYATFSTGLRFYPATPQGPSERVRPSDFFGS